MQETAESGYTKRAVTLKLLNLECLVGGQFALYALYAEQFAASLNRAFKTFRAACSFAVGEAALIMARFYMSPPARPVWVWLFYHGVESRTGLDSTPSFHPDWYACQV